MAHIPQVLPSSIPIPSFVVKTYSYVWYYLYAILMKIPGGPYVISYVRKSHQDDPYRTAVEIILILYGIGYYLSKPQQKTGLQGTKPNLTEQEVELLIEDWQPESIVDESAMELQRWRLEKMPVLEMGENENRVTVTRNEGSERYTDVLNLASNNFLQLAGTPEVVEIVKKTIRNYGVGACGPAGFYGNQDVHYNFQYALAEFFGTEDAVLYGQDFCVASSVLPAFTKRGDLIVADDQVSISSQNALQLSRSTVYYFEHNNMESLEALLQELTEMEKKERLPAISRKFIVTEGLFHNSGDIPPLPVLTHLKNKYKFRLFVDETFSLGVLGASGRGLAEHFNMERASSIDVTIGSMATALGSSGAFVLGDHVMSHHQQIGSNAYCFSASLPAYTTTAATQVLKIMDRDNSAVTRLHQLSQQLHDFFNSDSQLSDFITVTSHERSPVLHIQLTPELRSSKFNYTAQELFETVSHLQKRCVTTKFVEPYEQEEQFLQSIVDTLLSQHGILITRNTIVLRQETLPVVPSLKVCINSNIEDSELTTACNAIKASILHYCSH
ncbi:serine C-palmitoyltransferase LCB1 TDEL_0G00530 [Torulaspora delbrueckii]|uniref:serine C-palmitoyltransferase n=1 Tax=Torulaspora delbrueckii TaxID=4950 RepID=G8ZYE5_TORDE|nr:hypothetical protein TDEL_0G00530 [Torulaspora delbrueckii]CCE93420.1 hypothetical protein TDEL_0G00530 [Torulaspora delbrueckii]